ncbi:MAG: type II secretion system protein GspG [Phycisphaerales bacterium JB059]
MTDRRTTKRMTRGSRPGFSLLELTLVLVIMGMLMAVAAVNLVGRAKGARVSTTKASMSVIKASIESYMAEKDGSPPPSLQSLAPSYLQADKLKDAWKQDFFYSATSVSPDRPFQLVSMGPDKELGTEDDIDVWTMNDEE